MAAAPEERPNPDALLAQTQTPGVGRLKIFLGASPGVGKTYSMLEEARNRTKAGMDVVVALVETHGRNETEAQIAGLEVLPRLKIDYRGQKLSELDLDALLERRPQLAIIDEFAHTNAPGSRHPKRWQDIMEVLQAGIDVTTTLNIQHVESLNDVVARITGVKVQETVPDEVLAKAAEIELIDLPPDELIARLHAGKVYVPEQIGRALGSFFNKGNLTALRELALRTAATRVDLEMLNWMQSHAVAGPWPTHERLMVCINESPVAPDLVRIAKRMADRAKIPWMAVTVITPKHEAMGETKRELTSSALRLAESLGAEIETLRSDSGAAAELLALARKSNVTRILIGRARGSRLTRMFREPVFDTLLDAARDFEVTVVAPANAKPHFEIPKLWPESWQPFFMGVFATALAILISWPISAMGSAAVGSLSVVFLLAVLGMGARYGLAPAIFTSLLAFLGYNFFFTEPYFSFNVSSSSELAALFVFLLGALFTGHLSARLKAQIESVRASQKRTQQLFDFAKKIASVTRKDDVLWTAVAHVAHTLQARSIILMPDANGTLEQVQGFPSIEPDLDARMLAAAKWAFDKNEPAGAGTQTLPTGDWQFLPLATAKAPFGVIGVSFDRPSQYRNRETKALLSALGDQVAVAVERLNLADQLEQSRLHDVGDTLREALLNSVSHDLRTPLVSVIGSLTAMEDMQGAGNSSARKMLTDEALQGARRMDRYVQNLLNMTKLNHGALAPRLEVVDLREVIGQARQDLRPMFARNGLDVSVNNHAGYVVADMLLLGQALCNVIENAGKFSPDQAPIIVETKRQGADVVISVSDAGPGIPEPDRQRVFDLFYRIACGDTQAKGTGLGLAIVKGMVEVMGGTVEALPGPNNKGTTIAMTLKAATDIARSG